MVLKNISYVRVYTTEFQDDVLILAAAKMMEEHYSLIIVDSIMALFRVDFPGRGQLSERQQKLAQTLSKLIKLADQFNVAVVLTNQVTSDPGSMMAFGDNLKPIGGNILAHSSTTRLKLRKRKGDDRVCQVYDSPSLPPNECLFKLSDQGIQDAEE